MKTFHFLVCRTGKSWGGVIVYVHQFEAEKLFLSRFRTWQGIPHQENGHH